MNENRFLRFSYLGDVPRTLFGRIQARAYQDSTDGETVQFLCIEQPNRHYLGIRNLQVTRPTIDVMAFVQGIQL